MHTSQENVNFWWYIFVSSCSNLLNVCESSEMLPDSPYPLMSVESELFRLFTVVCSHAKVCILGQPPRHSLKRLKMQKNYCFELQFWFEQRSERSDLFGTCMYWMLNNAFCDTMTKVKWRKFLIFSSVSKRLSHFICRIGFLPFTESTWGIFFKLFK